MCLLSGGAEDTSYRNSSVMSIPVAEAENCTCKQIYNYFDLRHCSSCLFSLDLVTASEMPLHSAFAAFYATKLA